MLKRTGTLDECDERVERLAQQGDFLAIAHQPPLERIEAEWTELIHLLSRSFLHDDGF